MSIKRILVGVDGSDPSFNASTYAIDLAKRNDAELLHYMLFTQCLINMRLHFRQDRQDLKKLQVKEMEIGHQYVHRVKQEATRKKVNVKTEVVTGITSVVKEIAEYAESNKVDMIVIGNKDVTGFKKMLLGNVTSDLVTHAHCPVLVVK